MLKGPGTSGYEWKAHFDASKFRLLGRKRLVNRKTMGGGGKVVFRFRPLLRGDHEIKFDLIRPWETVPVAREEFNVTVS